MRQRLVPAGLGLLLLAGCAGPPAEAATEPVGHAELRVAGDWSGELDERGRGVVGMEVDDTGTATSFEARLTFADREGQRTEQARGELTPNGHLVIEAGEDAVVEAHITDPVTLDYCLIVYGFQPVYSCGRLQHEDAD
ncbi:MAG: hypothetical protein QM598_02550 [Protaetiibacter sp.]